MTKNETTLVSDHMSVRISGTDGLVYIVNRSAEESYAISDDRVCFQSNRGDFDSRKHRPASVELEQGRVTLGYSLPGCCDAHMIYELYPGRAYLRRKLRLSGIKKPLTLLRVELGCTRFHSGPDEIVKYDTFWNAPTAVFLRWKRGGLFAGIENPFFETESGDGEFSLAFEPSLRLEPGETYESEAQFVGVYGRTGRTISAHCPKTALGARGRYRTRFRNPCGHIPLDTGEIKAMRQFAADYLEVPQNRFPFILYGYWYPLPLLPETREDVVGYKRMIDNFAALDGDMVIFPPLVKSKLPAASPDGYWDVAPEASSAEEILDYAKSKGLGCGIYLGVACGNAQHGTSPMVPYAREERPAWKKVRADGGVTSENCLACDEFADWFYVVQRNTISRYDLSWWSWDPGPGNGFFCHSNSHGHLPGKGGYKGWRNSVELIRKLRKDFPPIYLQAFYGRKEYGLWGLKYYDQHEAYWEQQVAAQASIHPQLHPDRMNADGVRLQSWWSENFRFLPTTMNHALAHRITQYCGDDPDLVRVWDHLGWKYALLSALAVGGSVTACILPHDLDGVRCGDFKEFYGEWLRWARQNRSYVRHNISFGAQVMTGGVDGYARINGKHGYIFLCNPSPRPARTTISLNEEIGLAARGRFVLKELHPQEGAHLFDDRAEKGVFEYGDSVSVVTPPYEVAVFELKEFDPDELPMLFGVTGAVAQDGEIIMLRGVEGPPGEQATIAVLPTRSENSMRLLVNDAVVPFSSQGDYLVAKVQYDGVPPARFLDEWHQPDGSRFSFPFHPAAAKLELATGFFLDEQIKQLLQQARPGNADEIPNLVQRWRQAGSHDSFIWATTDRLALVVPFADADCVETVRLALNDAEIVPDILKCGKTRIIYYADITGCVRWGAQNTLRVWCENIEANQFLGPYLDYPPAPAVRKISTQRIDDRSPVVYERPVMGLSDISAGRKGFKPEVVWAYMEPKRLREGQPVSFHARVNLPPDELEGVYVSTFIGPGSFCDHAMEYDQSAGLWSLTLRVGKRAVVILDCNESHVWAVAVDGSVSDAYRIGLEWHLA